MARTAKARSGAAASTGGRARRRDAGRPRGEPIAEAVLARALEEFAAVGLAALSVDRIARAAEVNKTSVYRRWPTREALIAAALERALAELSLQQRDTGSLRGDLIVLCESVADFLAQPVGRGLTRAIFADGVAPGISAEARRHLEERAGGPALAMVQRALARGEWREDVDPAVILSMLVGALLHRAYLEGEAPTRPWIERIVDALVGGIGRPRAAR